ncbi:hypothetical protein OG317_00390 [Streptomyces sp. NBC_01167]|uniref:hypothetical protein n=1 Tax=Streptomyces sp. NBC_01167 TaxID=2903756 RepID=UPI003870487E|nr:hypothetical protein OG317_00390 [Streptomyces sp. NBC_01167]
MDSPGAPPLKRQASSADDTPMGEDVTLHDLLASNLSTPEDAIRLVAADEQLAALLRA